MLTPELAQQNAGLIAEVILTAADTFHEMLAAYRNNLQPPAGGALREHIQRLLNKPAAQAQSAPRRGEIRMDGIRAPDDRRRRCAAAKTSTTSRCSSIPRRCFPRPLLSWPAKSLEGAGRVLAHSPGRRARPPRIAGRSRRRFPPRKPRTGFASAATCRPWSPVFPSSARPCCRRRRAILLEILIESEAAAVSAGVKTAAPVADVPSRTTKRTSQPHRRALAHAAAENMLRVDAARIDTVMNLVGEMIIGKSMLQRAIDGIRTPPLEGSSARKTLGRAGVSVARAR